MTDIQKEKINRLTAIIKRFDLTQAQFAQRTGLSQPKVSGILKGKDGKNILNDIFYRLHYEFGISKEWWETGSGEMFLRNIEKNISENIAAEPQATNDAGGWKAKYEAIHEKYTELLERHNALLTNKLEEIIKDKSAI